MSHLFSYLVFSLNGLHGLLVCSALFPVFLVHVLLLLLLIMDIHLIITPVSL